MESRIKFLWRQKLKCDTYPTHARKINMTEGKNRTLHASLQKCDHLRVIVVSHEFLCGTPIVTQAESVGASPLQHPIRAQSLPVIWWI